MQNMLSMHFFSVMASLNAMASMRVIVFLYQLSILGDCSTIDSLRDLMISQIVLAYNCISVHVNMYISTKGSEASIASRMSTLESCLFLITMNKGSASFGKRRFFYRDLA